MKISLRALSSKKPLRGRVVLVRVDWNVPTRHGALRDTGVPSVERDASLKIERSLPLLKALKKRGAKVVVLTHLGRPSKRDRRFSTKPLERLLRETYGLDLTYHAESVANKAEHAKLQSALASATPGSIHLLENVRFLKGEEENNKTLAKAYADLTRIRRPVACRRGDRTFAFTRSSQAALRRRDRRAQALDQTSGDRGVVSRL
jgi:phosphoglycerate kinase